MAAGNKRITLYFSAVEALFFVIFAAASFQTGYLMELGMTSSRIGILSALGGVVAMVALPFWGILSDRLGSACAAVALCTAAVGVLFSLLPVFFRAVPVGSVWVYGYFGLIYLFKQPANSLLDGWAVSELTPRGIPYSRVRIWGSIGFAVSSVCYSALLEGALETEHIFLFMGVAAVPMLVLCLRPPRQTQTAPREKAQRVPLELLLKNRRLLIYLLFTIGLHLYLSVTMIFMAYILEHAGCQQSQLGLVVGYRAVAEIAVMLLLSRWKGRGTLAAKLVLAGLLFAGEHLLYRYASGLMSLLGIITLSGLAGGIFYSIGPEYLQSITEPRVTNTAQSLSGTVMALTAIAGTLFGGAIIEKWGIHTLTTGCGVLILTLTAIFAVSIGKSKT